MIILIGASASGKTEVAKLLKEKYHLNKVITHTTRAIRPSETQDVDYHFVSKDEFLSLKDKNAFVETTLYNDNYYGTSYKEIDDNKALIVDPNGLISFINLHDPRIISFYLESSEEKRMSHMLSRGDKMEDANKRIINDRDKFTKEVASTCDFIIDSDSNSIEEMCDTIYKLYEDRINKLK